MHTLREILDMKNIIALSLPMALLITATSANAFWGYDSQRAQAQSYNENRGKIDGRGNGSAEIDMDCDWAAKGKSGGNGLLTGLNLLLKLAFNRRFYLLGIINLGLSGDIGV